jgi:hypothetical protein
MVIPRELLAPLAMMPKYRRPLRMVERRRSPAMIGERAAALMRQARGY